MACRFGLPSSAEVKVQVLGHLLLLSVSACQCIVDLSRSGRHSGSRTLRRLHVKDFAEAQENLEQRLRAGGRNMFARGSPLVRRSAAHAAWKQWAHSDIIQVIADPQSMATGLEYSPRHGILPRPGTGSIACCRSFVPSHDNKKIQKQRCIYLALFWLALRTVVRRALDFGVKSVGRDAAGGQAKAVLMGDNCHATLHDPNCASRFRDTTLRVSSAFRGSKVVRACLPICLGMSRAEELPVGKLSCRAEEACAAAKNGLKHRLHVAVAFYRIANTPVTTTGYDTAHTSFDWRVEGTLQSHRVLYVSGSDYLSCSIAIECPCGYEESPVRELLDPNIWQKSESAVPDVGMFRIAELQLWAMFEKWL
ncbi:hypothetical protein AK812_SmicGene10571 [Symbiodinium microadriaticum]|uniref:Uncharacterized protein n=1 Tax=Symbiodinium microadriaticum TaxID=2951 RepID=A0A1Q9EFG3_SYMMI|nr:hypothetical protein AK812_SmicGene10571 [Symbiodinium microadriaticum]